MSDEEQDEDDIGVDKMIKQKAAKGKGKAKAKQRRFVDMVD